MSDSPNKVNIWKTFLVLTVVVFLGIVVKCVFVMWREKTKYNHWLLMSEDLFDEKNYIIFQMFIKICIFLYIHCPLYVIKIRLVIY